MKIRPADRGVTVWAPAKLNLFFEVLAKRSDGYHEVETLMVPVDRYDTLTVCDEPTGQVSLASRWVGLRETLAASATGSLPVPADNLAVKAVELVRRRWNVIRGARLLLAKRIPVAAGLGGASSDAAAALVAVNRLWQLGLGLDDLARLAAELGSDIPFFLHGGAAVCRGRGERIEPLSLGAVLDAVIVRPPVGLATAEVYKHCRIPDEPKTVGPLVVALARDDLAAAGKAMINRLEAPAAALTPWIGRLREFFENSDCPAWQMTGSGSCYFGLARSARHARRVAARARARGLGLAFTVRTLAGDCV